MSPFILVVEDDPDIRELICHRLEKDGFALQGVEDGQAAWEFLQDTRPDLILVDIMMPRMDGITLTRKIREDMQLNLPVIMVTAKGAEQDVVDGLLAGADDYVVKPFSMQELSARIQAVLRRAAPQGGDRRTITCGDLCIDPQAHRVTLCGEDLSLTTTEHGLLLALISHPGMVLSRGQLLDQVWGREADVFDRTVDAHMKNLRHKLGAEGDKVRTVRGVGYAWRGDKG